jgi:hypothetical protein
MDLSRQEYPSLLVRYRASVISGVRGSNLRQATLQPNQAVNILNDRVKLITTINTSIADWLQVSAYE